MVQGRLIRLILVLSWTLKHDHVHGAIIPITSQEKIIPRRGWKDQTLENDDMSEDWGEIISYEEHDYTQSKRTDQKGQKPAILKAKSKEQTHKSYLQSLQNDLRNLQKLDCDSVESDDVAILENALLKCLNKKGQDMITSSTSRGNMTI